MTILVRRAERSDIPTLHQLISALADFESLPAPDTAARSRFEKDGWPPDGEQPRFSAWLVERQQPDSTAAAIGYVITFETYSSFLAKPTLYLEDLFILPEHRRTGAGNVVFDHLLREANRIGAGRIEWVVLDWNTGAQQFYQQLGAKHLKEWQSYRLEI